MKTATIYGRPSIGCYLEQSYCNACQHDGRTVRLAMDYGFAPDPEAVKLLARLDNDVLSDERDDAGALSELADEAADWLNEQETRPFLSWYNSGEAGAFGLWPDVDTAREDCGFVSGGPDSDPDDSDYPAADYRGEWLHVNERGNCTLYAREDFPGRAFHDRELWAVV